MVLTWRSLIVGLLLFEVILHGCIIRQVPYTEIDWSSYMQQVHLILHGERNYASIKGDTGPLVYPAGHVYLFSGLYLLTNKGVDIFMAQIFFSGLYLLTLLLVLDIYRLIKIPKPYLVLLVLSKRIHSIYLLRLFNDPVALLFVVFALRLLLAQRHTFASISLSVAISIKMNNLLYLPGYFVILFLDLPFSVFFKHILAFPILQLIIGLPFILRFPSQYLCGAFDLHRSFLYYWSVNWKFISEDLFTSSNFKWTLLFLHGLILAIFLLRNLPVSTMQILLRPLTSKASSTLPFSPFKKMFVMMAGNFIGIYFSRSLHYQFYSWYFFSLPLLLYVAVGKIGAPNFFVKVMAINPRTGDFFVASWLWLLIEYCWNVFPSTFFSSFLLFSAHSLLLYQILALHST